MQKEIVKKNDLVNMTLEGAEKLMESQVGHQEKLAKTSADLSESQHEVARTKTQLAKFANKL